MDLGFLHPYFLGPQAENADLLERLLLEFVRDHCFWRRNFHPEDEPVIPPNAPNDPAFAEVVTRTVRELRHLSADLKRAVPFYSPRYVGHMSSEILLPALIARIVTTLYNPNNVSEDAAPITLDKELEVGVQLARMFGMRTDDAVEPCAWGHLTSGGTVANYEALWNLRSVKLYPVALAAAARDEAIDFGPVGPRAVPLVAYPDRELVNLSIQQIVELRNTCVAWMRERGDAETPRRFAAAVRARRIETLGTAEFFRRHGELTPPRVLVPTSAHYSWEKGMKVLGLGTGNLVRIAVDDHMRLDPEQLAAVLEDEFAHDRTVLAVVGVLGTTEFGTIDPIHEVLRLRDEWRARGRDFGVHVDAAWGGYLASVFRDPDGGLVPRETVAEPFRHFPSAEVHAAFAALADVDFVTVDPHKLGFVPYSAGAFVARDRRVVDFVTQHAHYVFDTAGHAEDEPIGRRLHNLGQFILEGSKPGASAASVWVAHRVLPLDRTGYGRLMAVTMHAAERFYDSIQQAAERLEGVVRIGVPFETDTNLVCLAFNPFGNRSLAVMNRFNRALFSRMSVDPSQPIQVRDFIGSYTSLTREGLRPDQCARILGQLDLDPASFVDVPRDPDTEADHVFFLRHTLMNPWILQDDGGETFVDRYWTWIEARLRDLLTTP